MNDAARFERVSELFAEAVALPADERTRLLVERCGSDDALRAEVEQLLQLDAEAPLSKRVGALDDELAELAVDLTHGSTSPSATPRQIGGYRILGELGRGGMGIVYRAEQAQPRRVVALKLMRGTLMDDRTLRRFEQEAEVLGLLHHPGIAQIFEASTARTDEESVPFFAMELVEGQSLTEYARTPSFSIEARLELLIDIGEALHHAHQKGVIHRDLKPANLLVTAGGKPKILDFGVARAVDSDAHRASLQTDARQILGTLPYMSPEQVTGDAAGIDIRSDVYSLGVVGYELLTGALPYEVGHSVPQAAITITEHEPHRLSAYDRAFRGDLDTIFGKVLEKDRTRRYQSATEFVNELRRFLRSEPIAARSPSAFYQLEKFTRRHRGLVAGLVVAFVVMIVAVIGMAHLTLRARAAEQVARDRANTEEGLRKETQRAHEEAESKHRVATAVNEFLNDMLASADPWNADGAGDREITVAEVLDRAADDLDGKFKDMVDVEAELRGTIGTTYLNLGKRTEARAQLEVAYDLQRHTHGERSPEALRARRAYAEILAKCGALKEAAELGEQLVPDFERAFGHADPDTMSARLTRLELLMALNDLQEAERFSRETYSLALAEFARTSKWAVRSRADLGVVLLNLGKLDEAEALQRETIAICREKYDDPHPETLVHLNNLASTLWRLERRDEAEEVVREVIAGRTELFGEPHPLTLNSINSLIVFLNARGAYDESRKLREQQLRSATEALGANNPRTLSYRHNYAMFLVQRHELEEAERHGREVYEVRQQVLPAGHEDTLYSMELLGMIDRARGRPEAAEQMLGDAVRIAEQSLPDGQWLRHWLAVQRGRVLNSLGRYIEAESLLMDAAPALRERFGDRHSRARIATMALRLARKRSLESPAHGR